MFSDNLLRLLSRTADLVWGIPLMMLLVGTGVYLSVGLRGISVTMLPRALRLTISPAARNTTGAGEVSPFAALMGAVSATVGVGNIAGVATAIHLGGPGALVWMWATGIVGLGTRYTEAFLAVTHRRQVGDRFLGGPMYYIERGMGRRWLPLAMLYAALAAIAAFGAGAGVQANSITHIVRAAFGVDATVSAAVLCALTFIVIIGGLRRIARVSEYFGPFMILFYVAAGLGVIAANAGDLPRSIALIFRSSFTGTAAVGGFAGAAVSAAARYGVARGLFSNEAGLGSAAILHAASRSNDAVQIGALGMVGVFIDTMIVNSITGLAIVTSGAWMLDLTGAPLTAAAFESAAPNLGGLIVAVGLVLFAFTTVIAWCVYGERCAGYLLGERAVYPYRLAWCAAVFAGGVARLDAVWLVTDIMNALMAVPNLIALLVLGPSVFAATRARLSDPASLIAGSPTQLDSQATHR